MSHRLSWLWSTTCRYDSLRHINKLYSRSINLQVSTSGISIRTYTTSTEFQHSESTSELLQLTSRCTTELYAICHLHGEWNILILQFNWLWTKIHHQTLYIYLKSRFSPKTPFGCWTTYMYKRVGWIKRASLKQHPGLRKNK